MVLINYRETSFQDFWDQTEVDFGVWLLRTEDTNDRNSHMSSSKQQSGEWPKQTVATCYKTATFLTMQQ